MECVPVSAGACLPSPPEGTDEGACLADLRRPGTLRRLLFASQKGGVGKTVTTMNVGAALGQAGRRVLAVDTDPNGGLAAAFGIQVPPDHPGVYGIDRWPLERLVAPAVAPNVDVLPYAGDRRPVEPALLQRCLTTAAGSAGERYDFMLLDTRPSIENMTRRLCQVVDEIVVVFQCHHLAFRTLAGILGELRAAREDGAAARVLGLVLTMLDLSDPQQAELEQRIRASLGTALLPTAIPLDPSVGEALMATSPVTLYRPDAPAAAAYRRLAAVILAEG